MSLRVLVCGGRTFSDRGRLYAVLDALNADRHIACVITGGARGADTLAFDWAHSRGLPVEVFPADWKALGRKAGPVRNQRMIDDGQPGVVIAFPGGRGTADMIGRAKRAGIDVLEWAA